MQKKILAKRAQPNPDWESNPGRPNGYKKKGRGKNFMFDAMSDEWFSPFSLSELWLSDERLSDERKGKLKKWTHERQRSRGKNWVGSG
jgi:hypothetical protein